jgi:hypothetical protein
MKRLFIFCSILAIFMAGECLAIPVTITDAEIGTEGNLSISGFQFDKGDPDAPRVWINDIEVPESDILHWSAFWILVQLSRDYELEVTYNSLKVGVTIPEGATPEGDPTEEGFEYDESCFHLTIPGIPLLPKCDFDDEARPVAVDRVVTWLIPNDPKEETFSPYGYKFGPAMQNHNQHIFGDPLYYQLLDNYYIDLETYLEEFEENPYGIELFDRCDGETLNKLKERLDDLSGAWDDNEPEPGGGYISIHNGILAVRKGYRWDGPSLEMFDSRTWAKPSALMRATVVHDALYDLIRLEEIEYYWMRVIGSKAFYNRKLADCMFFMLATQDHYKRSKAKSNFSFIRLGGASKTKEDLPFWKFHAVADAGEDQSLECANPQGVDVVLDGSESHHAVSWEWEVENQATGKVTQVTGEMVPVTLEPGTHTAKLTVDDGNDGEVDPLYRDTDESVIELIPDTTPPVYLLAKDQNVQNDPGQCSAWVDFDIIATDDCGPPVIRCANVSTGEPVQIGVPNEFPVGTTQVICTATDIGNNQTTEDVIIIVSDVEPPIIHGIAQPLYMWQPNHKYRSFQTSDFVISLEDNCVDPTLDDVLIRLVTSDEPENGNGDGNTLNDIVIASEGKSVMLRNENQSSGNGRVYTVHHEVADASGNLTTEPFQVHVINDKKGQAIDDGAVYSVELSQIWEE